jgi:hypothetical protein
MNWGGTSDFGFLEYQELCPKFVAELRRQELEREQRRKEIDEKEEYFLLVRAYVDRDKQEPWWKDKAKYDNVQEAWWHYHFKLSNPIEGIKVLECRRVKQATFVHKRSKGFPGHFYTSTCDKECHHCGGSSPGCGRNAEAQARTKANAAAKAKAAAEAKAAICSS